MTSSTPFSSSPLLVPSSPSSRPSLSPSPRTSTDPPFSSSGKTRSAYSSAAEEDEAAYFGDERYGHLPAKVRRIRIKADRKRRARARARVARLQGSGEGCEGKENCGCAPGAGSEGHCRPVKRASAEDHSAAIRPIKRNPFAVSSPSRSSPPFSSPPSSPLHRLQRNVTMPSQVVLHPTSSTKRRRTSIGSTRASPSSLGIRSTPAAVADAGDDNLSISNKSEALRVPIQPGQCLVFGRKPDVTNVLSAVSSGYTLLPVLLPRSFTHASRTHCSCSLTAPPLGGLTMRITVYGMNGLMVDEERFERGMSAGVELKRREGEEVELGYYGGKRVICEVRLEEGTGERRAARGRTLSKSGTGMSPDSVVILPSTGKRARASSFHSPSPPPPPAPPANFSPTKPLASVLPPLPESIKSLTPGPERARLLVDHLDLDLKGMVSAAVVFGMRSTVSTAEVVRGVVGMESRMVELVGAGEATLPGARSSGMVKVEDGEEGEAEEGASPKDPAHDERLSVAIDAWRPIVLETLQENCTPDGKGMFGCVTNEGLKDAAGEPLDALWYYQPGRDQDRDRRALLGPYVKKLRLTQTTSKQYFFRKVRGSGRRKS